MRYLILFSAALGLCLSVAAPQHVIAAEGESVLKDRGEKAASGVDQKVKRRVRQPSGEDKKLSQERRAHFNSHIARRWNLLDQNGDGILTMKEIPRGEKVFALMDKDGDGQITRAEHSEHMRDRREKHKPDRWAHEIMVRLDKNKDKRLDKEEAPRLFRQSPKPDSDGDGYLSQEELTNALSDRWKRRIGWPPPGQAPRSPGNEAGEGQPEG